MSSDSMPVLGFRDYELPRSIAEAVYPEPENFPVDPPELD